MVNNTATTTNPEQDDVHVIFNQF
ncbi:unnamed protein product, partial [Rotaria sp. Silwood2]